MLFSIIISAFIVSVAVCAVIAEKKEQSYKEKFGGAQSFFAGFTIITAVGASAMAIAVEHNTINFNWQAIPIAIIVLLIGIVLNIIFFNKLSDMEVDTVYPIISTDINLLVFMAASMIAWLK